MGCASSTPMVATAGSEMLKAATHVADDVKQGAGGALEDASQKLNETIDTAKGTVSSTVANITNELGTAFKDGTEAMDKAKHKVMEGLHLEAPSSDIAEAAAVEPSASRAATPTLVDKAAADADSLKTCTPEPEIERALANSAARDEEDPSPPTPQPTLSELAQLSAEVAAEELPAASADAAAAAAAKAVEYRWRRNSLEEPLRPGTTEWEKFADQLAHSRKFKPYESFAHSKNQFSVYRDYTSLRDKPGHHDGSFSDGNGLTSHSQSSLSSAHLTPANQTPAPTRRLSQQQREFAKLVACEQPAAATASLSRASSRLSNGPSNGRAFDYNPVRERLSLIAPTATAAATGGIRIASATPRVLVPMLNTDNERKNPWRGSAVSEQRAASRSGQAMPLHAHRPARSESNTNMRLPVSSRGLRHGTQDIKSSKPKRRSSESVSRNTDAARVVATPLTTPLKLAGATPKTAARKSVMAILSQSPARPGTTSADHNGHHLMLEANDAPNTVTASTEHSITPAKLSSLPHTPAKASSKVSSRQSFVASTPKTGSRSLSRASSTSSGGVVIRSTFNTPATLSPDPTTLSKYEDAELAAALAHIEGFRGSTVNLPAPHSHSSCFLSSPRNSPWLLRKDYSDKENKPAFIAELSSLAPQRREKSPASPYKMRERCDICCKKYVIN